MLTDGVMACPSRVLGHVMASDLTHSARDNVFMYVFEHTPSWAPDPRFGAFHSAELPFVFGNEWPVIFANSTVRFTSAEWALSKQMQRLWTSFASSGVPTGGDVSWPSFSLHQDSYLAFNTNVTAVITGYRAKKCNFWTIAQGGPLTSNNGFKGRQ